MAEPQVQTKLPENAYRELKPGETYVPMVPPGANVPEITLRSIVFGLVMNVLWAMAATYLALKVGQGIETAIPISILAVGLSGFLLKMGLRRSSIIENVNILAISTTSGMVAGGTVFTMPAIYLLGLHEKLSLSNTTIFLHIALVPFLGAILGVIFLVPFRRYFVKEMHGKLPFPEGTATNEILVTGQGGGKNAFILVYSFVVSAFYTVLTTAFRLWPDEFTTGNIHVTWKEKATAAVDSVTGACLVIRTDVLRMLAPESVPAVVFVTAYDEYAISAFEVSAVDYLLKPFGEERLREAINKVAARIEGPWSSKFQELLGNLPSTDFPRQLPVHSQKRIHLLDVADISHIISEHRMIYVHDVKGQKYWTNETLVQLEERLDPEQFFRVHRSSLVNLKSGFEIEPWEDGRLRLHLKSGAMLTVSRERARLLRERMGF